MTRLLVADSWPLFRECVRTLLDATREFEVVAEVPDGPGLCAILQSALRVDVALVDQDICRAGSAAALQTVAAIRPRLPLLILSADRQPEHAMQALRLGAAGYFTKESPVNSLVDAIRLLALGGQYLSPVVAEQLAAQWRNGRRGHASHGVLSARELSVFELLVQGRSGTQIASALCLSKKTVSTHKIRLLRKLQAKNLADLVRYSVEHDLDVERAAAGGTPEDLHAGRTSLAGRAAVGPGNPRQQAILALLDSTRE